MMRKPTMVFLLVALAAISAAMLVDLSPASPRQNVPATKQTVSGLSGALSQPARVPGSPANQLVANYGKLPLAFEANDGQTDGRVKFLSRGRGYSLFLTGDEAVLSLHKATGGAPNFRSASARVAQHSLFGAAVLPDPLSLSMPKEESENEAEKPRDRRTGPALPFSSPRLADNIESSAVLRMRLVGANASAAVTGAEELPGKSNYFIGNDPKKWRTNVPNYAKVKYQDVYPGVDLVYYGNQGGQLEYDFVVAPGADPETIRFALSGGLQESSRQSAVGSRAQNQTLRQSKIQNLKSKIDPSGDLVIETDGGEVRLHKPVVYQPAISNGQRTTDYGQRAPVEGHYVMQANNQVGFKVASYDHTRPLLIDPVLSYSTYLGGSFTDLGYHITVDSSGNAYVTGDTLSQNFPTANPFQATNKATPTTSNPTAFVAKLNSTGSALVYSTYLGGSNEDVGTGIAVDSSGNAYVTGYTTSTNFPTVNPLQVSNGGGYEAFVSKLNAAGSALVYSTYLGGSGSDAGGGIAVDSSSNAYVTGYTNSTNFPTANPFQASNGGGYDTFVSKLNAAGSALVYSTYLGGSGSDAGTGIAVDSSSNAYVTGYTNSTNFPTVNPLQVSNGGGYDAFVSKLNAAGSALTYSTYLGGSNEDVGTGIAVDSSSNAYVTGYTSSTDFPTVSPLQASYGGGNLDAFVAKFDAAGSALIYSTYLGGGGTDRGYGIAIDSSANAYVTGETISNNFPTTPGAFQQATADACAHFPPGYIPFTQVYYISDGVLVGEMTQASYSTLLAAVPLPITPSPYGFCEEPIQLAPGVFQPAQVPTAAERHGDFSSFLPFNLTNPLTGNPYINNMIPLSFPGPMAWPVGSDFPFPGPGGDAFVAKIDAVNAAALAISAQTLSFTAAVGSSSSQNLTLRSTGSENLRLLGMLAFPPSFSAATDPCSRTLSPGETCTITVTFRPRRVGVQQGSLLIFDNAYRRPETLIRLTGTGE